MPKLTCRLLYNQDSTNLFYVTKEPLEPRHVDLMVDEVAAGGVDVMLINPNAQRVNYPSRVWQTFWDGYAPGQRAFFGPIPEESLAVREHFVSQMKRLADQGCDYIARALARCRARGVAPGLTVRMNDMHDRPWPGSHLFSRFYMEHPQFHLSNPAHLGWGSTGLNYLFPEVRSYYLTLIGELTERYDVEVLQLDFLRFADYFPRDEAYDDHAKIMTGFIGDVRRLLARSGKAIALTCRVAATPGAAYELGFDVADWARERLVDGITAGCFFNTGWQIPVDEFRIAIGPGVALYVSTDASADSRIGYPVRWLPLEEKLLKGFAAGYLAAGVDGLDIFNFFVPREETPACRLRFDTLNMMKRLDPLRGQVKTYLLTAGLSQVETDGPICLPVNMELAQSRVFELWMVAEPERMRLAIAILCEGPAEADQLWLHINGRPAGPVRAMRQDYPDHHEAHTAVFTAGAGLVRDGRNILMLRNEGKAIRVISVMVLMEDSSP